MDLKDKRILVIGGAGFIGSHIVDALLKEPVTEVRVFDNFLSGKITNLDAAIQDPRTKIFQPNGDIMHYDVLESALEGIDCVFHLAGAWLLHCHQYPDSAYAINVQGTYNVIKACQRMKIKKLVFSSSASVYGDALQIPMTEEHPYNNFTLYGATKIAGEHLMKSMLHKTDVKWSGLRYMNVYGPRQDYKGVYTAVIHKVLDKIYAQAAPEIYGDGSQEYDFVYVNDVALANISAMKSDSSGEFYNVGTGIGTTIKELVTQMLKITGSSLTPRTIPQGLTFVQKRIGSTQKAKEQLGFEFKTPLDEGLRNLIEWRNLERSKDT